MDDDTFQARAVLSTKEEALNKTKSKKRQVPVIFNLKLFLDLPGHLENLLLLIVRRAMFIRPWSLLCLKKTSELAIEYSNPYIYFKEHDSVLFGPK